MKRIFVLLLTLCMLLCACNADTNPATEPTEASTVETTETPTSEPTTVPTEPPTEPPVLYRHPLTGEPLDALWTGRATAVAVNNIKACLPQHGIGDADILYEVETEGGITRCLAVFSDFSEVGKLGPIRSTRTYFNNLSLAYDAPLIHCGGSARALNAWFDDTGSTIKNWNHINQQNNGSYFYRDQDRRNAGYAYEHTLFTTGEDMMIALGDKKYNTANENGTDYTLTFADVPEFTGETANTVVVKFRGNKTTTMTYQADTGLYEASQYNEPWIDANTDVTLSFRNVLVLYTKQWFISDGTYNRSYYDLVGSGKGVFACDGKLVPIKWSRENLRSPFVYTLEDGTPLTLGVGTSYIGVVSNNRTVEYQ